MHKAYTQSLHIVYILLLLIAASVLAERYILVVEDTLWYDDTLWVPDLLPGRAFDDRVRATYGRYPDAEKICDWVLVGSRADSLRTDGVVIRDTMWSEDWIAVGVSALYPAWHPPMIWSKEIE